jgi:hypothetical protein
MLTKFSRRSIEVKTPREISVGAFSGVENAKMRGSSPEMPKTGSPLAKGELHFWIQVAVT